jgi:TatA/E family protein of Tat protein translocase
MNLGFTEMAFIFILALIIFGPKKLPEIGRQIGKALAEFKRASNEFKWQLEAEMRQIEAEATRERLIKAAPTAPAAQAAAAGESADNGASPGPTIKPPDMEIYPTTFGLEFRPTNPSQPATSELVDPETVKPEELKRPELKHEELKSPDA